MNKIKNLRCLMCGREISESENPLMCDKCKDRMILNPAYHVLNSKYIGYNLY